MSDPIATRAPRRTGWRMLAALAAAVAIVSLVHWHPLVEDSGSESLRDAASQCAACTTGSGAPATAPAAAPDLVPVAPALAPAPDDAPSPAALEAAPPRAPPA